MLLNTDTVSLNGPFEVKATRINDVVCFKYKNGVNGMWCTMPSPKNKMRNTNKPIGDFVQYIELLGHTVQFVRKKGNKIIVRIMKGNTCVGEFRN